MDGPLVSVVVPVHNGGAYLDQALDSIEQQDYQPFEVIVVDDGSTDGSSEIARRRPGVRCLSQSNQGVAAARNAGVAASRGELLAFLDQDDLWALDKLRLQVQFLLEHPDVGYVLAWQEFFVEPGAVPPPWLPASGLDRPHVGYFPGTLMVRRSVFEQVGPYDPQMPPAESADWFARAKDAGVPIAILPRVLLRKRLHSANQSNDLGRTRSAVLHALKASLDRQRRQATRAQAPAEQGDD